MLISFEHDPGCDSLEKVLAEARLRLGWREVSLTIACVVLHLASACLHVVDNNNGDVELGSNFLETVKPLRDCALAFSKAMLCHLQVLAEGIKHNQLQLRELHDDLREHLMEQILLSFVEYSNVVDAG